MNSKTKKVGEVSRILDISGMTTRNYCKHFAKHLSPDAIKPTRKRFTDKDIDTLIYAKSLLNQGKTYSQVSEILEQETPLTGEIIDDTQPDPEPEDTEPENTALVPIEFFNRFVEQLQEQHQTTLDAKDETISELKQDKTQLREDLERERHQKRQYYENLPWLVKRFAKPPE